MCKSRYEDRETASNLKNATYRNQRMNPNNVSGHAVYQATPEQIAAFAQKVDSVPALVVAVNINSVGTLIVYIRSLARKRFYPRFHEDGLQQIKQFTLENEHCFQLRHLAPHMLMATTANHLLYRRIL